MRFTIKLKLTLAFAAILTMLCGVAIFSMMQLSTLNDNLADVISGPSKRLELALTISGNMSETVRAQKNALLETQPDAMKEYYAKADQLTDDLLHMVDAGLEISSEQGRPFWQSVKENLTSFDQLSNKLSEIQLSGDVAGAIRYSNNDLRTATVTITESIGKLVEIQKQGMEAARVEAIATYENARMLLIIAAVGALLIGIAAAAWIALGINSGLRKIMDVVRAVSIGDLNNDVDIKTNDEIKDLVDTVNVMTSNLRTTADVADKISNGDLTITPQPLSDKDTLGIALQAMVERLRGVVADAIAASHNVSSGSQELSSSSEQLSQGATEQASSAKKPPLRWKRWPPTSSRTPTTRPRRKRSPASPPRTPKPPAKPWARPWSPCARLPRRSPSSRKSPARPTFWRSTRPWKRPAPANTARASRSLPRKCASSPNAARRLLPKSAVSPARPCRSRPKPARC